MVMRFIILCMLMPMFLFSGEFSASVNRTQVDLTGGFTLTLTLKDASAKTSPSIESIMQAFQINSQQQTSNTSFINGKISSSISWKFLLTPRKEGEITIPSISIDSSDGTLITQPITIQVVKGIKNNNEDASNSETVSVTTSVSNEKPYKNEPIFYTLKLSSKQTLVNLQTQKFQIDDAIVELLDEPKIYEKIENGNRIGVIEFNYLLTPLKTGPLRIPSQTIQGGIPVIRKSSFRSIFDDEFDPIAYMQGFDQIKPFVVITEETILEVQPAVAGIIPWLPAKSLTVKEIWDDSQPIQEGEFFTRNFIIEAEGINSSQLPSLNDVQVDKGQAKVYADKPELSDEVKFGKVASTRKEQYTIIPLQAGSLILPEISITWWDVTENERRVTSVPARKLEVMPAVDNAVVSSIPLMKNEEEPAALVQRQDSLWIHVLIGLLVSLVIIAFIWVILLQKRMNRLLQPKEQPKVFVNKPKVAEIKKDKKEKLNDLNPT
jgi:hypothetical protein